jgi:hypothetical protein
MKKIVLFSLFAAASSFALACSNNPSNGDGGTDAGPTDSPSGQDVVTDSGGNPAPPQLKTQVDRMGRPAINTALNHVFDPTSAAGTAKVSPTTRPSRALQPTTSSTSTPARRPARRISRSSSTRRISSPTRTAAAAS